MAVTNNNDLVDSGFDDPANTGQPKKNMEDTMNKLKNLKDEYRKKYTANNFKNQENAGLPKKK